MLEKIKPEMETLRNRSDFGEKIYKKLAKSYPYLQTDGFSPNRKSKQKRKNKQRGKKPQVKKPKHPESHIHINIKFGQGSNINNTTVG